MPPLSLYARARTHSLHCVRDRRCGVHPAFPAPSRFRGGTISSKTRAHWRRGNAQSHSSFRGDAKASNPESRDSGFARARPGMTTEGPAPRGAQVQTLSTRLWILKLLPCGDSHPGRQRSSHRKEFVHGFVAARHRGLWRHRLHRPARRRISGGASWQVRSEMGDGGAQPGQACRRARRHRRPGRHAADRRRCRRSRVAAGDGRADPVGADDRRSVPALWQRTGGGLRGLGHRLSRSLRRAGLDATDDRCPSGDGAIVRGADRVFLRLRFASVRTRGIFCSGNGKAGAWRARQPRQGSRPQHEGNVLGRNGREHQGDVCGGSEGSQSGRAAAESVRADARLRRPRSSRRATSHCSTRTSMPGPRRS